MSRLIPQREPAWLGVLRPGVPEFTHPVHEGVTRWLLQYVTPEYSEGGTVQVLGRLLPAAELRPGHFLVSVEGESFVFHVKSASGGGDLEISGDIADYLSRCGLPVATYRRSRFGRVECQVDGLAITVTRYRPGRHVVKTTDEARALGGVLARMHRALGEYPLAYVVYRRTQQVSDNLLKAKQYFSGQTYPSIPQAYWNLVLTAAVDYDPEFSFAGSAQCIHGDLTPGNVVFQPNGEPWICDFEDAAFGFRSPALDVATVLLRFCLDDQAAWDESRCREWGTCFLNAYEEIGGLRWEMRILHRTMLNLVDHNVLILASLAQRGYPSDAAEWLKFARLRRLAGSQT